MALSLFRVGQLSGGLAAQLMPGLVCCLFFVTWALHLQRGLCMSPLTAAAAFVLLALGEPAGARVAMTVPVVLIGVGLGVVGGPLSGMSLAKVPARGRVPPRACSTPPCT